MDYLLYGGGIDSSSLFVKLFSYGYKCNLIHINYGQKAYYNEIASAKYFSNKYGTKLIELNIDLSFSNACIMNNTNIGDTPAANKLELRNVVFITLASSYINSLRKDMHEKCNLYVGFHKEPADTPFQDAKVDFINPLLQSLELAGTRNFSISAPFKDLTRTEILRMGYNLDNDVLNKSYTCYEQKQCNQCSHCLKKKEMIKELNI